MTVVGKVVTWVPTLAFATILWHVRSNDDAALAAFFSFACGLLAGAMLVLRAWHAEVSR